ncbi:UNVERIFIED_CONTAM: hypothetical protein RKD50_003801 [Streptomyces canus]
MHLAYGMRQFIARQDWLTVFQLPSYAPDLNPIEGISSLLRRGWLSNTAFTTPQHLIQIVRHGMRNMRYRPDLIDGCLTRTGLSLTPMTSGVQAQRQWRQTRQPELYKVIHLPIPAKSPSLAMIQY